MKKDTIPKIVFLVGPSCVGKSALAIGCAEKSANAYRLSADQIRASLRKYDKDNQDHAKLRNAIFYSTLLSVIETKVFDIYCEVPRSYISSLGTLTSLAKQEGFSVYIVFLDASDEALKERFDRRVEKSKENNYKLAVSDKNEYMRNVEESRNLIKQIMDHHIVHEQPQKELKTDSSEPKDLVYELENWMNGTATI